MPKYGQRIRTPSAGGGGGAAPGAGATVTWGPDFGNADQMEQKARLALAAFFAFLSGNVTEEASLTRYRNTASYHAGEQAQIALRQQGSYKAKEEERLSRVTQQVSFSPPLKQEEHLSSTYQHTVRYPDVLEEKSSITVRHTQTYNRTKQEARVKSQERVSYSPVKQEGRFAAPTFAPRFQAREEARAVVPQQTANYKVPKAQAKFSRVEYFQDFKQRSKDSWARIDIGALGTCVDTANRGLLNVVSVRRHADIVTTENRRAIVGFDLSHLPANVTVTSAVLHLRNANVAGTTACECAAHVISSASENWTEAAIVCSNMPAPLAQITTFTATTVGGIGGDTNIDITAAATRIANRAGSTSFSILITAVTTGTLHEWNAGTTVAAAERPSLSLAFTVPST